MAGRIVLFGATGYTGRLVAHALVGRGVKPVLAARNARTLEELANELGNRLETQVADVSRPETVRALVEKGDVLVSTVGPFLKYGEPAVEAAIDAGAHYIDSTGEPPFIRRVFEQWGPRAERSGSGLVTAFGYDFVPGNLAGALALAEAGDRARRVAVGYFFRGSGSIRGAASGGTMASMAGVVLEKGFAFRDGRLQTERGAKRVHTFEHKGRSLTGVSIGSSEHLALPRLQPGLLEVDCYLGWFGPASRAMQVFSLAGELPGARAATAALANRLVKGSTGGPDEEARSKSGSRVVAEAYDASGERLSKVVLDGPNGYTFTGDVLAWGAQRAAETGLEGTGALGPVDGYGLRTLETGCGEAGLVPVTA